MEIQLNGTSYSGCDLMGQVSRNTSNIPGLTTLNFSIELPISVELPQKPQLISCVLSEDTASPIKWFTGWYLGATAKPANNNESFLWTFKIVDILYYLANSKPVNSYSNSTSLEGHAIDLAAQAERPATVGSFRYLDIEASPADTDPFSFAIENNSLNLQAILAELAKRSGYEIVSQEAGWLDQATLFASTNAITRIIFREPGSSEELAPITLANYDPSDPDFCDDFPFTDFSFGWETEGITSVEVLGKNGAKAKQDNETVITSYSKYRSIPIVKPQTDAAITSFDFAFELSADINKLNQVLVLPELGQLEVLFPYDPNTPLTTGQVYFDKESNPPRVLFFQDDITGLTVDNTCYVLENFQFIKVVETDSASGTALGAATHGAFNKAYRQVNDPAIADFPTATSVAQSTLAEAKKANFFCSGKRLTTTENWLNGQLMQVTIPSQSIDKFVKVVSSSGVVKGKVFDSGTNAYRDEIDYSLTFAEVDKNIFSGSFLGRLGAMARGSVGSGGGGIGAGFPTYDEIPFDGGGATACSTITVITGENYTESNDLFDPQFNLPTTSTEAVTLVHTANIWNVKQSANFGFYLDGSIDTTEGNLTITWNGTEIYNQDLDASFLATTTVIPLTEYQGTSGELIASLTLPAQPTTNTSYQAFIEADCCAIDTIIGSGVQGFNTDGNIPLATDIYSPTKIKIYNGEIIFADADNFRVRKLDNTTNTIVTIGGNGDPVSGADAGNDIDATTTPFGEIPDMDLVGDKLYVLLQDYASEVGYIDLTNGKYYNVFTAADFNAHFGYYLECNGLVVDPADDTIYFSGIGTAAAHSVIYKYDGAFSIYAGTDGSGNNGFSGDGGAATSAKLDSPWGIELDSAGNLYIADTGNGRIRKVTKTTGIITTVAGGGASYTFESDALDFNFDTDRLYTLEIDNTTGDIYFVDSAGFIGKLKISDNKIYRIAGTGYYQDFLGDTGSPLTAFFEPFGVFAGHIHFVSATQIYVADSGNNRIRQFYCGLNPNCPNLYTMIADGDQSVAATNLDGTPDPVVSAAFDTTFVNGQQVRYFETGASEFYMFDLGGYCEFDLDLTDPKFVGHTVGLKILRFFSIVFNVEANSIDWEAITKINGTTVDTFTDSFINPPATSGGESTTTSDNIDLSSYLGTTITVRIDFTSVLPDRGTPDIATHTNRFTLLLSC